MVDDDDEEEEEEEEEELKKELPDVVPFIGVGGGLLSSAGPVSIEGESGPVRSESQINSSFRKLRPRVGLSIDARGGNTGRNVSLLVTRDDDEKLCSKGLGSSSSFVVCGSDA